MAICPQAIQVRATCWCRVVPDALQMVDSTVIRAHRQAAGAKGGDSAAGFWPLKRWLHDQDPPSRQCSRLAHEADRLSRPQSFVAKYENGERRIEGVEFVQIIQAIGCDAGAILELVQQADYPTQHNL